MDSTSRRIPDDLVALAARQHEIVTRRQLRDVSPRYDRDYVRRQVRAGRWTMPAPNVVALHTGRLTKQQLWCVAVAAHADQLVALAGVSAAELHGLRGFEADVTHVVVPRGARAHRLSGVKVHESRRFSAADVHPTKVPAAVSVERALVDAAVWSATPRRACALLAAGVQQRLTTPDRLLAELHLAGQVRFRRLLGAVLLDVAGGSQALSELDLVQLCRKHGLPEPLRQVVRRDVDGRRRWLDAVFRLPDGRELVVEIDGAAHLLVQHYVDDLDRTMELVIDGKLVVRIAAVSLRATPERVVDQLRRLLGVRAGTPRAVAQPRGH